MDPTRYVQIICGVCGGKTLAVGGQARPAECGLCKAPFEAPPSEASSTDPAVKGVPATFARGTFTNLPTQRPRKTQTRRSTGSTLTPPGAAYSAVVELKEKLIRLFHPRS